MEAERGAERQPAWGGTELGHVAQVPGLGHTARFSLSSGPVLARSLSATMPMFIVNTNIPRASVPEGFLSELTQQLAQATGKPAQVCRGGPRKRGGWGEPARRVSRNGAGSQGGPAGGGWRSLEDRWPCSQVFQGANRVSCVPPASPPLPPPSTSQCTWSRTSS